MVTEVLKIPLTALEKSGVNGAVLHLAAGKYRLRIVAGWLFVLLVEEP